MSKIYKQSIQFNTRKTNNLIKKQAKDINRHFSKEYTHILNKHMKRCSTLFIIREMQIKTTMRYHLTVVTMAIIKKSTNSKCGRQFWEKGNLLHCWWECKLVKPLWRRVWIFLKKLKIDLPHNIAFPLLGIYPEKIIIWKDTHTPMFIVCVC